MKYVTVAIAALLHMVGRASAQENSIDSNQVKPARGLLARHVQTIPVNRVTIP